MKNILLTLVNLIISASFLLLQLQIFPKAAAQDYSYKPIVEDAEEEETSSYFLERKKKKKGKKTGQSPTISKNPTSDDSPSLPQPPPCEQPMCLIQDPVLPDEVCNNDCPKGSGWHCQGRHNLLTHELYAVCVPD